MPRLALICAMARNGVIGLNGSIPWKEPEDMRYFRDTTMGHPVIMGRKTWESLGKYAPLKGRANIVISRTMKPSTLEDPITCVVVRSLEEALYDCAQLTDQTPFVIGGEALYREALPLATDVYLTHIDAAPEGDTYFPRELFRAEEWDAVSSWPLSPTAFAVHYERRP